MKIFWIKLKIFLGFASSVEKAAVKIVKLHNDKQLTLSTAIPELIEVLEALKKVTKDKGDAIIDKAIEKLQ